MGINNNSNMTPEQLQELKEKAELWDSLSDSLRTIFCGKFERPIPNLEGEISENGKGYEQFKARRHVSKTIAEFKKAESTIENISNSSSHIGLLREESREMVKIETIGNNAW